MLGTLMKILKEEEEGKEREVMMVKLMLDIKLLGDQLATQDRTTVYKY